MSPPQETAILLFHYQTYLRNLGTVKILSQIDLAVSGPVLF